MNGPATLSKDESSEVIDSAHLALIVWSFAASLFVLLVTIVDGFVQSCGSSALHFDFHGFNATKLMTCCFTQLCHGFATASEAALCSAQMHRNTWMVEFA